MTVPGEVPIRMPRLSATAGEVEFADWLVAPGDTVTRGTPLAVVLVDKVDMEIESEVAGTVTRLTASEGDVVAVGEPLGYLGPTDATAGEDDHGAR